MAWGPKQRPREATWETLHANVGFFPRFGDAGVKFMSIDGTRQGWGFDSELCHEGSSNIAMELTKDSP